MFNEIIVLKHRVMYTPSAPTSAHDRVTVSMRLLRHREEKLPLLETIRRVYTHPVNTPPTPTTCSRNSDPSCSTECSTRSMNGSRCVATVMISSRGSGAPVFHPIGALVSRPDGSPCVRQNSSSSRAKIYTKNASLEVAMIIISKTEN
jgi:hypothetical protein